MPVKSEGSSDMLWAKKLQGTGQNMLPITALPMQSENSMQTVLSLSLSSSIPTNITRASTIISMHYSFKKPEGVISTFSVSIQIKQKRTSPLIGKLLKEFSDTKIDHP